MNIIKCMVVRSLKLTPMKDGTVAHPSLEYTLIAAALPILVLDAQMGALIV
ncbi:MAG: hypothetical protein IBX57_00890 [Gammaproteobacteria bacterium]|nr:hypothetical protein [Gammaproteobacteria bacterium]